ncbi:MAG: cupin domain-containing protein [Halobacteriota archaeon]
MRSSKTELSATDEGDGYVFRETVWGGMRAEIDTFDKELNMAPRLKGLPDDMDPVPHWGYVLKGRFRVIYKGHEEVVNAGDMFYVGPQHVVIFEAARTA